MLVWPHIFGLRPAVLVINPFYRTKRAPTSAEHADIDDPATRDALMKLHATLPADTMQVDAKAFVAFLDQQAAIDTRRKLGITDCREAAWLRSHAEDGRWRASCNFFPNRGVAHSRT